MSRRVLQDRTGAVLILTALSLPVLLGFAGLSIDVGSWYMHRRAVQSAADAAAIAAALEVRRDGDWAAAAGADAGRNGLRAKDAITVNHPPASGPYAATADAVEVIVMRPSQAFFSQIFLDAAFSIGGRAVAVAALDDTCLWALDRSQRGAVTVAGTAQVGLDCGVMVNSDDATGALTERGAACLTATRIKVVGGFSGDCFAPDPITGAAPVDDPLAALPPPSYGACDHTRPIAVRPRETRTLNPGVYCGPLHLQGTVQFNPGVYILDGAGLTIDALATVSGAGVTFYLTRRARVSDNITIAGGADVALSAPTSGPYAGILFYQDRAAPNMNHVFAGGAAMQLDGILYFPNQDLLFAGGSSLRKSPAMLVVKTVDFVGDTFIGDFEDSAAGANPILISAVLVE